MKRTIIYKKSFKTMCFFFGVIKKKKLAERSGVDMLGKEIKLDVKYART